MTRTPRKPRLKAVAARVGTDGPVLCATKNEEVVEYALSRSMSPAFVAEYQTRLPEKKLLQAKLHEFYALAREQASLQPIEAKKRVKPQTGRKSS